MRRGVQEGGVRVWREREGGGGRMCGAGGGACLSMIGPLDLQRHKLLSVATCTCHDGGLMCAANLRYPADTLLSGVLDVSIGLRYLNTHDLTSQA